MSELLYDIPWLVEQVPDTLEEYGCSDQLIDLVMQVGLIWSQWNRQLILRL